jgi:ABC-type glycerol-3-phosphate transport system substrate-binding protein
MEGSKYPELAKDFVAFWMEPKRLTNYYHADPIFVVPGEIPIIKSAEYWKNELLAEYKPAIEKMIELNVAGVDPNMENPGVLQPATGIITQRLVITDCVQEVVLGQATAEQAAAKAHKKMEEIMVELKKK